MLLKLIYAIFARLFKRLARGNRIFYIGGTESLPRPLSPEEETFLLERMDSDPAARSQLIEHNLRLVVFIAKKSAYVSIASSSVERSIETSPAMDSLSSAA